MTDGGTRREVNHFPGTCELSRKDKLWQHVSRMRHRFGAQEFGFCPETYLAGAAFASGYEVRWHAISGRPVLCSALWTARDITNGSVPTVGCMDI